MIRLHPKNPLTEKPRVFSEEEAKKLAAFLIGIIEDDVESVRFSLNDGLNYTYPQEAIKQARSSGDYLKYGWTLLIQAFNEIRKNDKVRKLSGKYPILPILANDDKGVEGTIKDTKGGVISLCIECLSISCLKYFSEKKLYFDAEPSVIPLLYKLEQSYDLEYNRHKRGREREILEILNSVYEIDPNYYVDYRDVEARGPLYYTFYSYGNGKCLSVPLFAYFALTGHDEIFNFLLDIGADLNLTAKCHYYNGHTEKGNELSKFENYTLRELSVLNFSQRVFAAYLSAGKKYTEKESIELLKHIFNQSKGRVVADENLSTIGMLTDSLQSLAAKESVFDILYKAYVIEDKKSSKEVYFSESQLYNLMVILRNLSSVRFKEKISIATVTSINEVLLFSDGNYRIPRFILDYGMKEKTGVRTDNGGTAAHKIIANLLMKTEQKGDRGVTLSRRCLDYIAFLCENGLDMTERDEKGRTVAEMCFHTENSSEIYSELKILEEKYNKGIEKDPIAIEFIREW